MTDQRPPLKYGEWTRGNAGQVGRTVTDWYRTAAGEWRPIVRWEPHPDEAGAHHG